MGVISIGENVMEDKNCKHESCGCTNQKFKLSKQALAAFMMALQMCLMEEIDIVQIMDEFELQNTLDGLIVLNPPVVKFDKEENA